MTTLKPRLIILYINSISNKLQRNLNKRRINIIVNLSKQFKVLSIENKELIETSSQRFTKMNAVNTMENMPIDKEKNI